MQHSNTNGNMRPPGPPPSLGPPGPPGPTRSPLGPLSSLGPPGSIGPPGPLRPPVVSPTALKGPPSTPSPLPGKSTLTNGIRPLGPPGASPGTIGNGPPPLGPPSSLNVSGPPVSQVARNSNFSPSPQHPPASLGPPTMNGASSPAGGPPTSQGIISQRPPLPSGGPNSAFRPLGPPAVGGGPPSTMGMRPSFSSPGLLNQPPPASTPSVSRGPTPVSQPGPPPPPVAGAPAVPPTVSGPPGPLPMTGALRPPSVSGPSLQPSLNGPPPMVGPPGPPMAGPSPSPVNNQPFNPPGPQPPNSQHQPFPHSASTPNLQPPSHGQQPNNQFQYPAPPTSRPRYPSYPRPMTSTPVSNGLGATSPTMPPLPPGNGMPPLPPGNGMPPLPAGNGMPPPPSGNGMSQPGMGMPPMPQPGGMPPQGPGMPPVNGQPGSFPNKLGDMNHISNKLGGLSVTQQGFRKLWGQETLDLLQNRHILPPDKVTPPEIRLQTEQWNSINCDKDIFRCTLNRIPETDALLKKARLPLGVLIHPYKDLSHLPVIQCSTIVRCRSCRTYINPFVHFVDQRRWRCNICYRVNELPEEFLYDPVSKTYGDPSRRPECKSSTIEFIAPSEYMLRPPQPAVYLFLLDVSRQALESGYLRNYCDILLDELDKLPGDGRTQLGFITFDRTLHFYMMPEGASQVSQLIVGDIDDIFLPSPSDLLINLQSCKEQIVQMLNELPELFNGTQEVESCLGAALNAAYKMMSPTGGRITVLQCSMPNIGPGALTSRENSQQKDKIDSSLLGPTTDFYKKLALECSGQQIAVDLFILANQHVDLATVSGISKFSGGQVSAFLGYHSLKNLAMTEKFDKAFRRYLTRKIGFESVMRIRCTRGMSLHTFHGHFFVRSTDLLSLPNVNPDAGFGMQVSIDEDLKDSREVSFQAALLYTSSKGERRIRVHTLCLPISNSLQEIIQGADQQCIVGLLSKMAVDRSLNASIYDAKEAFVNACIDIISRWRMIQCANQPGALLVSPNLSLVPLYILALLKSPAFTQRSGVPLDDRTQSMIDMKCLPLSNLIQSVYPDMYRVDQLDVCKTQEDEEGIAIPDPDRLQLSAENIAMSGVYLMDLGDILYLYLGKLTTNFFCEKIFGVSKVTDVDENLLDLPELDNDDSERLRSFIHFVNNKKSHSVPVKVIRDDGGQRHLFISKLIDDRSQSSYSYYEFLQQLKSEIK